MLRTKMLFSERRAEVLQQRYGRTLKKIELLCRALDLLEHDLERELRRSRQRSVRT